MWLQQVCKLAAIITFSSIFAFAGMAEAKNERKFSFLKGRYYLSMNINCVFANGDGFAEDLTLPNGGRTNSMAAQGEYIFNGDGTGTRFINWLAISNHFVNPGQTPFNYGTSEANFTYTAIVDGMFETTSDITTVIKAFGPSQTIEGFDAMTGAIEVDQNTFIITATNPNIEIMTLENGVVIERICNKTGIGIKIK
jgi:hypothetical protein